MYLIETFLNGPLSELCENVTLLATGVNKN